MVILPSADTEMRASALPSLRNSVSSLIQLTCHTGCRCLSEHLLQNKYIRQTIRWVLPSCESLFPCSTINTRADCPYLLSAIRAFLFCLWTSQMARVPSYIPTASWLGLMAEKSSDVTQLSQRKTRSGHCTGDKFRITVTPKRICKYYNMPLIQPYSPIEVSSYHRKHWLDYYSIELKQGNVR